MVRTCRSISTESSNFQLNFNDHAGPTLGVPFALAVPAASLAAPIDIALVVKVDFA